MAARLRRIQVVLPPNSYFATFGPKAIVAYRLRRAGCGLVVHFNFENRRFEEGLDDDERRETVRRVVEQQCLRHAQAGRATC